MHPAIIIATVRSLIVDVAMGQIPRSTERIFSFSNNFVKLRSILISFGTHVLYNKCPKMRIFQNIYKMENREPGIG